MTRVDIPGVGIVEFPPEMSPADIQAAIETDILKTREPTGLLDRMQQGAQAQTNATDPSALGQPAPGDFDTGDGGGLLSWFNQLRQSAQDQANATDPLALGQPAEGDFGNSTANAAEAALRADMERGSAAALAAGRGPMTRLGDVRSTLDPFDGYVSHEDAAAVYADNPATAQTNLEMDAAIPRGLGSTISDAAGQVGLGIRQLAGTPASLLAPESETAKANAKWASDAVATLSPQTRARLTLADQKIKDAAKDGLWEEVKAVGREYFTDPVLAQHFVMTTLPSMIPVLGSAKVAQAFVLARGGSAAAAQTAASIAAGGTNAVLTGGDARQNAYDDLFATYKKSGLSDEEAKQRALSESKLVAGVGMTFGWLGGRYGAESAFFTGAPVGSTAFGRGLSAFLREVGTELPEELMPLITTNTIANETDGRSPLKDVPATAGQTIIGVGPMATSAGVAAARQKTEDQVLADDFVAGVDGMRTDPDAVRQYAADAMGPDNAQMGVAGAPAQMDPLTAAFESGQRLGIEIVNQRAPNEPVTEVDAAGSAGTGLDPAGGAGVASAGPVSDGGVRVDAGTPPLGGGESTSLGATNPDTIGTLNEAQRAQVAGEEGQATDPLDAAILEAERAATGTDLAVERELIAEYVENGDASQVRVYTPETLPDIADQGNSTTRSSAQVVGTIASAFGRKVVFYDSPGATNFGDGFVIPRRASDTIFLRAGGDLAARPERVFGHEFYHTLNNRQKAAFWNELSTAGLADTSADAMLDFFHDYTNGQFQSEARALQQQGQTADQVLKAVIKANNKAHPKGMLNAAMLKEEFAADIFGNRIGDTATWKKVVEKLKNEDQGALAQIAQAIQKILSQLKQTLGSKYATDQFVKNLEALQDTVAEAVAEQIQSQRTATLNDGVQRSGQRIGPFKNQAVAQDSADFYQQKGAPKRVVEDNGQYFLEDTQSEEPQDRSAQQRAPADQGRTEAAQPVRERDAAPDRGVVPEYGEARDNALSVVGTHYSRQVRASLSGAYYGSGLKGQEAERLKNADPRLRQRIYFYVDTGKGVTPEDGVGSQAHEVTLNNIYDAAADPLDLKSRDLNTFETAVLEAGFDGYLARGFGANQAAVVLLGSHTVGVKHVGQGSMAPSGRSLPEPVRSKTGAQIDRLLKLQGVPGGQVTPERWSDIILGADPELHATMDKLGVFEGTEPVYRSELAGRMRKANTPLRSTTRTQQADNQLAVTVGGKPGQFGWSPAARMAAEAASQDMRPDNLLRKKDENYVLDASKLEGTPLAPFTAPTQLAPNLMQVGDTVRKVLQSKQAKQVVFDITGATIQGVSQIHGSWEGKAEPSFVLTGSMTYEQAVDVSKLFGVFFAQDAVVTAQPWAAPSDDQIPAILISQSKALTAEQVQKLHEAASAVGLDYSTTLDGRGAKFLYFGDTDTEAYYEMYEQVDQIRQAAGLKDIGGYFVRSELHDSKTYLTGGVGQVLRGAGDQDATGGPSDLFRRAVDHLLVPYAKAVGAEGYRFSPDLFGERFGLTEAQVEYVRAALRPKSGRAVSTVPIVTGQETLVPPRNNFRTKKPGVTKNDLLWALQNRTAAIGQISPTDMSPEAMKIISDALTDEVSYMLGTESGKNAVGWYDAALKRAKTVYQQVFPELTQNKDRELMFDAFLGIASQGNDVHSNAVFAGRMYHLVTREGMTIGEAVDALYGTFGKQTRAIEKNYLKLEKLLDSNGYDKMRSFFNTSATVGELNAILRKDRSLFGPDGKSLKIDGESIQTVTGWSVFGPKIGSFINNLHGDYSTLTADLWFSRTWNRYLGNVFAYSPGLESAQYVDLYSAMLAEARTGEGRDLVGKTAYDVEQIAADPDAMLAFAEEVHAKREQEYKTLKNDAVTPVRQAAKNLVENRTKAQEAPRKDTERGFQQRTVEEAQKKIRRRTGVDISIADIQAVIWYYEKDMFKSFGVGDAKAESADYAEAARRFEKRYNEGELFYVEKPKPRYAWGTKGSYLKGGQPQRSTRRASQALASAFLAASRFDGIYQVPTSDKTELTDIVSEVIPRASVRDVTEMYSPPNKRQMWRISIGNSDAFVTRDPSGRVWINVAAQGEGRGGRQIYAAVGNWAANNGYTFIGDPEDISTAGKRRRLENMVSLKLKFPRLDVRLHQKQLEWLEDEFGVTMNLSEQDSLQNLGELIRASYEVNRQLHPEIENAEFQPDGTFRDRRSGEPFDFDRVAKAIRDPGQFGTAGAVGAPGRATLHRAALAQSIVASATEDGDSAVLEMLYALRDQSVEAPGGLRGILYSRPRLSNAGRELPRVPAQDIARVGNVPGAVFATDAGPRVTHTLAIGVDQVTTPEAAAHVLAGMRRNAEEKFQVLVLDAERKPISVLDLFAGATSQTSVFPGVVAKAVYETPGAASVWYAHNHLSGRAVPSEADLALTRELSKSFGLGTGIDVAGHVVIAGNQYGLIAGISGTPLQGGVIKPRARNKSVPVTVRRIKKVGTLADAITSPTDARQKIQDIAQGRTGVVFGNAANAPVAFLPMSAGQMETLRDGTSTRLLFGAAAKANASTAFLYFDKTVGTAEADRAQNNVMKALGAREVSVLDAFYHKPDGRLVSMAEQGILQSPRDGVFRSTRRAQTDTPQFKKWFRDSRVVDAEGKPLVVYHGTTADLENNAFDPDMIGQTDQGEYGAGIYFTPDPTEAQWYAGTDTLLNLQESGGNMIPVFLSIQNPYITPHGGFGNFLDTEQLRAQGYDGVFAVDDSGNPVEIVAFDPAQIKSATGNDGSFDGSNPDIRRSPTRLGFYSALERAVERVPARLQSQPAAQWKAWLTSNAAKLGVKADEIQWSGITDWLDMQGKRKVEQGEILEYLKQGGVQVQETRLGTPGPLVWTETVEDGEPFWVAGDYTISYGQNRYWIDGPGLGQQRRGYGTLEDAQTEVEEWTDTNPGGGDAKYAGWRTKPEGENYREVLLTLPTQDQRLAASVERARLTAEEVARYQELESLSRRNEASDVELAELSRLEVRKEESQQAYAKAREVDGRRDYTSTHWDQKNVLAHIRLDDRIDADGNKVLFVQEVQSDWGQDGRKQGFATGFKVVLKNGTPVSDGEVSRFDTMEEAQRLADRVSGPPAFMAAEVVAETGTPTAPFVTDTKAWSALAIKRIITMAVEGGYDKVAFVSGEQAAEMFSLDKRMSEIAYAPDVYGGTLIAREHNSNRDAIDRANVTPEMLPDLIGKELAERLLASPIEEGNTHVLRGDDLQVEAKGMRRFYDQIIPQVANDVLKKLGGGKVGTLNVSDQNQLGFDITPAMREKVQAEGVPLFSRPRASSFAAPAMPDTRSKRALDKVIYNFQDRLIDLKAIQSNITEAGRTIRDEFNPYMAETLMHGKAAYRNQLFLENEIEPMLKVMRATGVSIDALNQFLHARHAKERNAAMRERNPSQAELDQLIQDAEFDLNQAQVTLAGDPGNWSLQQAADRAQARLVALNQAKPWTGSEEDRNKLSGMSDDEADRILAAASPVMRRLGDMVDRITHQTRMQMLAYGLESADVVSAMEGAYAHYVPLQRDMEESDLLDSMGGTGQGLSIKGSQIKRATGSVREVENILAQVVAQREQTIVRGEKNRVAKALYGMMLEHPNEDLYAVIKPGVSQAALKAELLAMGIDPATADEMSKAPTKPYYNERTGLVEHRVNPLFASMSNALVIRVAGQDRVMLFNNSNDRAVRLVRALRNEDTDFQSGGAAWVMSNIGPVTRYLAAINTQYNPIFGLTNFARDLQGAVLNLETTPIHNKRAALLRSVPSAMAGIVAHMRGNTTPWSQIYAEFLADGGATGYRDMFATLEKRGLAIQQELNQSGLRNAVGIKQTLDFLSDYNTVIENAIRLAAYKVARDSGMSRPKSADLAKDITVNFNRKGARSGLLASLYAFFNSAVQGTERTVRVIRSKNGRRVVGGLFAVGALNALLGVLLMGDDWDEIPEYERAKNLILPMPWGDNAYIKIPYQLGFNAIPNLGRTLVEAAWFQDRLGERGLNAVAATADAFNPVGSSSLMGMIAPSFLDPIAELYANKNHSGREIWREDMSSLDPTPAHTRAKDGTSAVWVELSRLINGVSGGDDYEPGLASVPPEVFSYLLGVGTGGLGREIEKTAFSIEAAVTGAALPPHKVPIMGRFYGEASGNSVIRSKFNSLLKEVNIAENQVKGRARDGKDFDAYLDLSRFASFGRSVQREVSNLRKEMRLTKDREERVRLENEIADLQLLFVERVEEARAE